MMKRYYKTDKEGTEVKVSTNYNLGGANYFSGGTNPRGYYYTVRAVERSSSSGFQSESFMLFEGFGGILLEVARKGAKAAAEAEVMAKGMADELAGKMADKADLVLTGEWEDTETGEHS